MGYMEPAFLLAAAVVASIVGSIVGAKRGVKAAEDRVDTETAKLVSALTDRVALLETANREKDATIGAQNTTIATLTARVTGLEHELALERAITARIRPEVKS